MSDINAVIREAKARQDAELAELENVLHTLRAVETRYGGSGSRRGNLIATRAKRAENAIREILTTLEGDVR